MQIDRQLVRYARDAIDRMESYRNELAHCRSSLECLRGELREYQHGTAGVVVRLLLQQRDEALSKLGSAATRSLREEVARNGGG